MAKLDWQGERNRGGILAGDYDTVHTAQILQSPPDPAIFHERGQPLSAQRRDQLNCLLIMVILKPFGAVVVVHRGKT